MPGPMVVPATVSESVGRIPLLNAATVEMGVAVRLETGLTRSQ